MIENVIKTLNTGIELESRGIKFYTKAAEEVLDPKGRQTLHFLANEEREHLQFIRNLKEQFEKNNPNIKNTIKKYSAKNKTKVFPKLEPFVKEIKNQTDDKLILDEAEEIEIKSINHYKSALKINTNESYQEIFKTLIKEEEGHLQLIQQMSDYMTLHGVWSGLEDHFSNE